MKYKKNAIKQFTRILKDIGLYSEWIKSRKQDLYKSNIFNKEYFFHCVDYNYFDSTISSSFTWSETPYEKMWRGIYNLTYMHKYESIIGDETLLKALRKCIKQSIDK